ncbi:TIGR03899 family protein [Photobacterium jeanii]|uniref:TIGR03899 family protein n=1 Tax=Photobacterium jeanii TaxID=858640 RepID=UPI000A0527BC|nr:TIGR03899 family protein [Photobacterium jeanii]PST87635.1 TIGR03899 family protein [Photobacterium jeanii]
MTTSTEKNATELSTHVKASSSHTNNQNNLRTSKQWTQAIAKQLAVNYLIEPTEGVSLEQRTLTREKRSRELEQQNLEQIFKLTHDVCNDESAHSPDPDWLAQFMAIAKTIHSPNMQKLWSRVLKREMTTPNSFSIKALETLKRMTKREAHAFQHLCTLASSFGNEHGKKLITGINYYSTSLLILPKQEQRKLSLGQYQLPYHELLSLIDLGILFSSELESGEINSQQPLTLTYQQQHYKLQAISKRCSLLYYRLSPVGNELAHLLPSSKHEGYQNELISLLSQHFSVES